MNVAINIENSSHSCAGYFNVLWKRELATPRLNRAIYGSLGPRELVWKVVPWRPWSAKMTVSLC